MTHNKISYNYWQKRIDVVLFDLDYVVTLDGHPIGYSMYKQDANIIGCWLPSAMYDILKALNLLQVGALSTCIYCGRTIKYDGTLWEHLNGTPNHTAEPISIPGKSK